MPVGSEIVSAMDNDAAGAELSDVVKKGRGPNRPVFDLRFSVQETLRLQRLERSVTQETPIFIFLPPGGSYRRLMAGGTEVKHKCFARNRTK